MSEYLKQILEHATSQGYRSNVLKPLLGMEIILLIATIFLFRFGINVLGYILGSIAIVIIICFLFGYFYCLFKDPNLLRSERYNLEKTALEKVAISGDSGYKSHIQLPNHEYVVVESINDTPNLIGKDDNDMFDKPVND